jgi:hypothetical protein
MIHPEVIMDLSSINVTQLLLLLAPVLLIQIGMAIFALLDLRRRRQVRGPRPLWAVVLIVMMFAVPTGIIASAVYLAWGRNVEADDDTD